MSLRKAHFGRQEGVWTKDQVIAGLLKFLEDHGRFPKTEECDAYPYLPTGRSIQRSFGGIVKLRNELGINESYHTGKYRSMIAKESMVRSRDEEERIYKILKAKFGEVCVHQEQTVPDSKERLDFVVYHKKGKFGVDVFCVSGYKTCAISLSIKLKKYSTFTDELYFVPIGTIMSERDIEKMVINKKTGIAGHIHVLTESAFLEGLGTYTPLQLV